MGVISGTEIVKSCPFLLAIELCVIP